MIKFGDIRRILDKWTSDCKGCELRERDYREEDVDDGIFPYETCSPDCSTYYVKKAKEEIMSLIDNMDVSTSSINSIPCKLFFKGMVPDLPEIGNDGDLWYVQNDDPTYKHGNYYWYDNKWNYIPVQEFLK